MDLAKINEEYENTFSAKWFKIGASELLIGYVKYECKEFELLYNGVNLSLHDMGYLMMSCLKDWKGVKDIKGKDIPFNTEQVSIALLRDGSFLELVTSIAFDRQKFLEMSHGG